jgi:hypothetical protein
MYMRDCMSSHDLFSEMNVAGVDAKLTAAMARNVAKTVVFFCTKSEQLVRDCMGLLL